MNVVLIVDPISSGAFLAPRIHARNKKCIALISYPNVPESMLSTFRQQDFEKVFTLEKGISSTISEIESFLHGRPEAVICGAEPGVEITDYLAKNWGLIGNSADSSHLRRNKFFMQEALFQHQLASVPSFKSNDIDQIVSWATQQSFQNFVLKPLHSLGTDQVFFCHNQNDIKEYASEVLGKKNLIGKINQEVLIQKYLSGTEYVVDAVSYHGKHYITDIAVYSKERANDSAFVYRQMTFIDPASQIEIKHYIEQVLNALDVQYGPSHNELILTTEGTVLLETGARLHGGLGPKIIEACCSVSLIDLTVDAYLDQAAFERKTRCPATLKRSATELFLVNKKQGWLSQNNLEKEAKKLSSYYLHSCSVEVNQKIAKTIDLMSSPGSIVLLDEDPVQIHKDIERIHQIEDGGGFFEIQTI